MMRARNKRGVILIASYMVIAVLLILGVVFIERSISEGRIAQRHSGSLQALWLAEAGIARGAKGLPGTTPVSSGSINLGNSINGAYSTNITSLGSNRYSVASIGTVTYPGNKVFTRNVETVIEYTAGSGGGSPASVTCAMETTGLLEIGNNASRNIVGSTKPGSSLTFETVFGTSKETLKSQVVAAVANQVPGVNLYTNPVINQPAVGLTWVNLTGASLYKITNSAGNGSGFLIVDGRSSSSNAALEITGGNFDGVIWVIGKVTISGNPVITGSLFAETSLEVTSTVSGTATLIFSSTKVTEAFNSLSALSSGGKRIISWNEV